MMPIPLITSILCIIGQGVFTIFLTIRYLKYRRLYKVQRAKRKTLAVSYFDQSKIMHKLLEKLTTFRLMTSYANSGDITSELDVICKDFDTVITVEDNLINSFMATEEISGKLKVGF